MRSTFSAWRHRQELNRADPLWKSVEILSGDAVSSSIEEALQAGSPFLAGKVGANELNLLYWSERISIPTPILGSRRVHFSNTHQCETNAGLKPRSRGSYHEYAELLKSAVQQTDLLGVWFELPEFLLYQSLQLSGPFCNFFDFDPWFNPSPWSRYLEGKKIFVVSPFLDSFRRQYLKRSEIWKDRNILPELQLEGFKFPFLFSRSCPQTWQEAYRAASVAMQRSSFDVALLGCGALGLPLGNLAKGMGKQALHLGGMLQILFGVHGKRYRDSANFAALMNEAWMAPDHSERPYEAGLVENGCYW